MEIRKLYTAVEETFGEMDRMADEPLRKVAAIAVVKNPLAGNGYIEHLGDLTGASTDIGRLNHRVGGPSKDDIKDEDGLT